MKLTAVSVLMLLLIPAAATADEKVDLNAVYRIKAEALQNSKVWSTCHF